MFWRKKSSEEPTKEPRAEKLPGPKQIPETVRKYVVNQQKKDPTLLASFKAVLRKRSNGESAFDIRLFDESEAIVKDVAVKDYTSLDEHLELIFYEGWFDKKSGQVELQEKRALKAKPEVPTLSEAEILQKIEGLAQPGSTVFFYLGGSPAYGGPFSRGAAVVERNPNYPVERQKKYLVYLANVDGLELVSKRKKMFDADRPKEIAKWVKERHYNPSSY